MDKNKLSNINQRYQIKHMLNAKVIFFISAAVAAIKAMGRWTNVVF